MFNINGNIFCPSMGLSLRWKLQNKGIMENSVIISPRVINTINSLQSEDRIPITNALSMEFILGNNPEHTLTPNQQIIYAVIRFYVNHDSKKRC